MHDLLYILSYVCDGSAKEFSYTSFTQQEAFELATSQVSGGEGLLECITLCDGMDIWDYSYDICEWVIDHPPVYEDIPY